MRKHILFVIISVLLILFLNFISIQSVAFSDFYAANILPFWLNTYGRITGVIPFSVGEFMIVLMLMLIVVTVASGLVAVFFILIKKQDEISNKIKQFFKKCCIGMLYISCITGLLLTLNCFIYYHCTKLMDENVVVQEYSLAELTTIRNYIVMKTNELSLIVERDENGKVVYNDNIEQQAVRSMQKLGGENSRLSGYYPAPKKIMASGFLSQQSMKGYYFPFSMEANYNGMMGTIHIPATMCHELAHVKGYLFEEEANMLAFLACINSDDITFQYSGYLSVLNYIDNDYFQAINKNKETYLKQVRIEDRVRIDNTFVSASDWIEIEEKAMIKTETIKKATQTFTETTLVMNGVSNGVESYSDVVKLLLYYYDQIELKELQEEAYLVDADF